MSDKLQQPGSPFPGVTPENLVMWMPFWPGARRTIELAIAGTRESPWVSPGAALPDGSRMIFDFQILEDWTAPADLYNLAPPPYLAVTVMDRTAGLRMVHDLALRVRQNDAEKYLREINDLLGDPKATLNKGVDASDSRRRYWFKLDA